MGFEEKIHTIMVLAVIGIVLAFILCIPLTWMYISSAQKMLLDEYCFNETGTGLNDWLEFPTTGIEKFECGNGRIFDFNMSMVFTCGDKWDDDGQCTLKNLNGNVWDHLFWDRGKG